MDLPATTDRRIRQISPDLLQGRHHRLPRDPFRQLDPVPFPQHLAHRRVELDWAFTDQSPALSPRIVREEMDRLQPDRGEEALFPLQTAMGPLPLEKAEGKVERVHPHLLPERGRAPSQLLQEAAQLLPGMECRKGGTLAFARCPGPPSVGEKSHRRPRSQEPLHQIRIDRAQLQQGARRLPGRTGVQPHPLQAAPPEQPPPHLPDPRADDLLILRIRADNCAPRHDLMPLSPALAAIVDSPRSPTPRCLTAGRWYDSPRPVSKDRPGNCRPTDHARRSSLFLTRRQNRNVRFVYTGEGWLSWSNDAGKEKIFLSRP